MISVATDVKRRRTAAAQMSRDGASLRRIADALSVSKDTVRRDLAAAERDTGRHPDATDETHDATPTLPAATPEETRETAPLALPGAHPTIVTLAHLARDARDNLPRDTRQLPYVLAVLSHATDILTTLGPLGPLERQRLRDLTARQHALTEQEEPHQ